MSNSMNESKPAETPAHPRLFELVAELYTSRRELLEAVAEVPADVRDRQPHDERWTLAQILEHIWVVENGSGRLITKLIREVQDRGTKETDQTSVLNTIDAAYVATPTRRLTAPEFTRPVEGLTVDQALERLQASRKRLLESLESARGYALGNVSAPHPAFGPLDCYRWILATAYHERRHTHQIRELSKPENRA